jgi:hypothetical protein
MRSKLVRKLAYELAGAFFDNADVLKQDVRQRSARFRAECKDQRAFIAKHWTKFVPTARQILAHQLKDPNKPQNEKDLIFDALLEDRGFASETRQAAPNVVTIQ